MAIVRRKVGRSPKPRKSPKTRKPRKSPKTRKPRKSPKTRKPRKSPKTRKPRKSPKARKPRKSPKARKSSTVYTKTGKVRASFKKRMDAKDKKMKAIKSKYYTKKEMAYYGLKWYPKMLRG